MENKPKTRPIRPTRGDKRVRTRKRIIEAAGSVINEKGFDLTTFEEVARRAGMTRGAIYNNFEDKEDLLLAVVEASWKPQVPTLTKGDSLRDHMKALGQAVAASASERRKIAVGAVAFQLYALTHEKMRARVVAANGAIYEWAEQQLLQNISADELPMPPSEFVRVLHALTDGLLMLRFLTPELISDQTIVSAFEALA